MKVAVVASPFPPYFGGVGNTAFHNALEIARLGHKVKVFTSNYPKGNFPYPKEIGVERLNYWFKLGNGILTPGLVKLKGFDLVHLHLPYHFGGELAALASKARGIPMVSTYQMDVVGKGWKKRFFKFHEKVFLKSVLGNSKKIIVSSMDYAENSNIKEIFKERKEDVSAIPNGVGLEKFNPKIDCSGLKKKLGLRNRRVVLFVGALDKAHYFKGVNVLLDAFSKIQEKNALLLVVGEGELKKYYRKKASELGIKERVVFTGRVEEKVLPEFYALADFAVLPSTDKGEAFGLVLAEAMACGKAVIASDLPGVRNLVEKGINGLLVNPRDSIDLAEKMEKLLGNKSMCRRMGKNGRKKAEKEFGWKKIALKIEDVYLNAVKGL